MVGDILQPTHLLFVLVVALLVLGPKRLPEVGRTLGNGIRDFRSAINGESPERREEINSEASASQHSEPEPDPEAKHEFAHDGAATPETHEFAHAQPEVTGTSEPPAATRASEATQDAPAATATAPKHEFAHESPEPAENPAGPRTS